MIQGEPPTSSLPRSASPSTREAVLARLCRMAFAHPPRPGRVATIVNRSERDSNEADRLEDAATSDALAEAHEDLEVHLLLKEDQRLTGPQQRARLTDLWRRAFREAELREDQLLPFRIVSCYRVTREIARLQGRLDQSVPLATVAATSGPDEDPWRTPRPLVGVPLRPCEELETWPAREVLSAVPTALVPTAGNEVDFHRAAVLAARGLGMDPPRDLGLRDFAEDPARCLALWPAPALLVAWERVLVDKAASGLGEGGNVRSLRFLREEQGLSPREALAVCRMARDSLREEERGEIEEDRALMRRRLDELAARCRTQGNLKTEMAALKQLALVVGLTRADPEDQLSDFLAVARRVSEQPLKIRTVEGSVVAGKTLDDERKVG